MTPVTGWETSIAFPPFWFNLPLGSEPDEVGIDAQVDDRVAAEPDLAPARQQLVDLLLGWAGHGREVGAAFGGMRWQDDPTFGVAMATFLAFRLERKVRPVQEEMAELAELTGTRLASDQFPPRLTEVELPWARSLRVEAVRDLSPDPFHPEFLRLCVQHWVPVDGTSDLLQFDFTAANLALAHELSGEFDAITAGFSIVPPATGAGTPTTPA